MISMTILCIYIGNMIQQHHQKTNQWVLNSKPPNLVLFYSLKYAYYDVTQAYTILRLTVTCKDFLLTEKSEGRRKKTQVQLLTLLAKMSSFTRGFMDLLRLQTEKICQSKEIKDFGQKPAARTRFLGIYFKLIRLKNMN